MPRPLIFTLMLLAGVSSAFADHTQNIMLTGYWPPTSLMLRQFSTDPALHGSAGYQGANWEDRGYNIYSFFPSDVAVGGVGSGDFTVDYQDTSSDWWRITEEIKPVAIITFSWTPGRQEYNYRDWEVEARNRNRDSWTNDSVAPYQPDQVPPDGSVPANYVRYSTLPMQGIVDAVTAYGGTTRPYIDDFSDDFGGTFLSEYIGYHGLWYQSLHASPDDTDWCAAAGHIHVGQYVGSRTGEALTEVTLRVLTDYLDTVIPEPTTLLLLVFGTPFLRRR